MSSGDIYSSNGVGAVICSRHGLVRPLGVGDIQKGERCVFLPPFTIDCSLIDGQDMLTWITFSFPL